MTATIFTELHCDAPGCLAHWPNVSYGNGGPRWCRKRAAESGWHYDPNKGDFCPKHATRIGGTR